MVPVACRVSLRPDEGLRAIRGPVRGRERAGVKDGLEHDLWELDGVRGRAAVVAACHVGLVVGAVNVLAVPAAVVRNVSRSVNFAAEQ